MSGAEFAMWLGLIAIVILVAMFFGVRWIERPRPEPEPVEHGDGEP